MTDRSAHANSVAETFSQKHPNIPNHQESPAGKFLVVEDKQTFDEGAFVKNLPGLMRKIDIDTSRFVEYVWAYRASRGLETHAFIDTILESEELKIDVLTEVFNKHKLECVFSSEAVWRAIVPEESDPTVPKLVIGITHYTGSRPYAIVLLGDSTEVREYERYFKETYQAPEVKKVSTITGVARDGSFRIISRKVQSQGIDMGHDSFYPFITGGVDQLAKDFYESKESVLLLIGPKGTGKSTLIRTLMLKMNYEHYGICNSGHALEHPEIVDWIGSFPESSLVALEDADNFIMSRAENNKLMSGLLNLADGIVQNVRKLVISTNLPSLNTVDSALIRPGRTFKVIHFRSLTPEESVSAREAINKAPVPLSELNGKSYSLAELLNWEKFSEMRGSLQRVAGFTGGN